MRSLARLAGLLLAGGCGLALGLLLLIPQARALLTAGTGAQGAAVNFQPLSQRSLMYALDGTVVSVLHAEENRQSVPLTKVPPVLAQAVIDLEDERFWTHHGVDLRGTARAFYSNVQAGGVEQGGSTITQQLVKNAFLSSKRNAGRKLKEAVLALRLESQLSKSEILERYLNTVYFGNGAYGVQAAAEGYFGKSVEQVTPPQAALLAGVIRNPTGYDPFTKPEAARARRNLALQRMVSLGHMSSQEAARYSAEPLPLTRTPLPKGGDGGLGYFVEEVKQRLLNDKRLGDTPQERYQAVFRGGLQIYTTLDLPVERAAAADIERILPNTNRRFTAALVSLDAQTGAVRSLVGGPGFEQAKFNLATQGRRQAGSAFKVFTLVSAFENGRSPYDLISGTSPCSIPNPGGKPDPWQPENYEGRAGGTMTLADATANSINCAYARLAMIVGVDKIADAARRMGIVTPLEPTPAMTLGGLRNGVSPLEMASAYATLASDGNYNEPYFVEKVVGPGGKVLFETKHEGRRVVSSQVARMTTQVLRQVVRAGTGFAAQPADGRDAAGKTGTAEDYQDAWFVGYTPQLATAVWMGAPVAEVPMHDVGGIQVTGGSFPARIWSAYMSDALRGAQLAAFVEPDPNLIPQGTYLRLPGEPETYETRQGSTRRPRRAASSASSQPPGSPAALPTAKPGSGPKPPPGVKPSGAPPLPVRVPLPPGVLVPDR